MKSSLFKPVVSVALLFLLLPLVSGLNSCKKNKECKAVITVLNMNNLPVSGAQIELRPNGNCVSCQTIEVITATSDGSGKANFNTNLPKIMEIWVNGANTGKVVRFEEGETDEVTVNI
jgi:hypothetical protein